MPSAIPPFSRKKHQLVNLEDRFEQVIQGDIAVRGVGLGKIFRHDKTIELVPNYPIAEIQLEDELDRFNCAISKARHRLNQIKAGAEKNGAKVQDIHHLLDAHIDMLENSRLIRGTTQRIQNDLINAEAALEAETHLLAEKFSRIPNSYLSARVNDVKDISERILQELRPTEQHDLSKLPPNTIILASNLTPSEVAQLSPKNITGIACDTGGMDSHIAIIARALNIPLLLGCAGITQFSQNNQLGIIDALDGVVILNPSKAIWVDYEERAQEETKHSEELIQKSALPTITQDGHKIQIAANLEFNFELPNIRQVNADGLGLVRSEFLYMNKFHLPTIDEQTHFFTKIVEGMQGKTVTIRTLDIGSDKLAESLSNFIKSERNPALGLRAIRLSLSVPNLLEDQFEAILKAQKAGPVKILLPMVTSVSEIMQARQILHKTHQRLLQENIEMSKTLPPLGVMIETPAAALIAEELAKEVDFFSIGTNDLIQYCLAADRDEIQVKDQYNPLHPAVIRLLEFTVTAAHRHKIPVSVCGEMAADPDYIKLLLGLGIRSFSISSMNIPLIKEIIRNINFIENQQELQKVKLQEAENKYRTFLDKVAQSRQ